jgi:O-antigen/teichoic acid export membrane protein
MLSNLRTERDGARYKKCLAVNFLLTFLPAAAVALPVAIFAPLIVGLYGHSFEHGAAALTLISIAAVITSLNLPVGHLLWSLEATVPAVLLSLLRGITLVLAAYWLATKGAAGLAGAHVITGVIQTAVTIPVIVWLLRKEFLTVPPAKQVVHA